MYHRAKLFHKDRKIFLPFVITSTLTEKSIREAWYPPKDQSDEYWEKKEEADNAKAIVDEKKKKIAELNTELNEADKKRKSTKKEMEKSKKGKYVDDDDNGEVSDASSSAAALSKSPPITKKMKMKAYHHFCRTHPRDDWSKKTKKEKQEYMEEHREEFDWE